METGGNFAIDLIMDVVDCKRLLSLVHPESL